MLATTVSLADVSNVEGFVAAARERAASAYGLRLSEEERTELLAEGIAALYELAARYEPHRHGYTQAGCFSGYASMQLPRRMADAWHRLHEHRRVSEGGSRRWDHGPQTLALEEVEESTVVTGSVEHLDDGLGDRLEAALAEIEPWQRLGVRRMCELARDGHGSSEIAAQLGIDRARLGELRERLGRALESAG